MNTKGVFRLSDMIGSPDTQAGLENGSWVRAVPEPYHFGFVKRVRAAWDVVTGSAVAVEWPSHGDLERAISPSQQAQERNTR